MNSDRNTTRLSGSEQLFMLNPYTFSSGLTPELVEQRLRDGRRERSELMARALRTVVGAMARLARRAGTALLNSISRAQQQRARRIALAGLDRHLLDDVGLGPAELGELSRNTFSEPVAPAPAPRSSGRQSWQPTRRAA